MRVYVYVLVPIFCYRECYRPVFVEVLFAMISMGCYQYSHRAVQGNAGVPWTNERISPTIDSIYSHVIPLLDREFNFKLKVKTTEAQYAN